MTAFPQVAGQASSLVLFRTRDKRGRLSYGESGEVRVELADDAGQVWIAFERFLDLPAGVQHGTVIASSEIFADLLQRQRR